MERIVRPTVVHYVDAAGRRAKKGDPGVKPRRVESAKYYASGVPGYERKRFPLSTDRRAAEKMLRELVRAVVDDGEDPAAFLGRKVKTKTLGDLLTEFERDLALGIASRGKRRRKRPPDAKQVTLAAQRVRDVIAGCGFTVLKDINRDAAAKVAAYLQGRTAKPRKEGGCSHQTADFLLAAARRFVWWLSKKRRGIPADLLDDVPGFEPGNNRVHARRAVSVAELADVLDAALGSKKAFKRCLSGADRYHLYLTAFATGYRAQELAALTPERFRLRDDPPVVELAGKRTKNRKAAAAPIPPAAAVQLRAYLAGKPAGEPVWPGMWWKHAARMLRGDLEAAGVPYAVEGKDGPEYADFHALRHSFVSALAAAGVGPKELQELARHSDARLTLGLYSHTTRDRLAGAVNRLELPGGGPASPFAGWTRDQLETGLELVVGVLGVVTGSPQTERKQG